jgi:hypothetical protein
MFSDIHKEITSCHKCQIFEGKRNLVPLSFKPIFVEAPFQQWGLDFIGEINHSPSRKHRWILTATDYSMKWIEAIPTKKAIDIVIIQFIEENILARFSCPRKTVTDNDQAFKLNKMVRFCE